jgi:hypothetical protein
VGTGGFTLPSGWPLSRVYAGACARKARSCFGRPEEEIKPILNSLRAEGFVEANKPELTTAGYDAADALRQAGCERLQGVLADWEPEQHAEVLQMIDRFVRSVTTTLPAPTPAS